MLSWLVCPWDMGESRVDGGTSEVPRGLKYSDQRLGLLLSIF